MHIITMYLWICLRLAQAIDAHSGYDFPWSLRHFVPFWAGAEHHDYVRLFPLHRPLPLLILLVLLPPFALSRRSQLPKLTLSTSCSTTRSLWTATRRRSVTVRPRPLLLGPARAARSARGRALLGLRALADSSSRAQGTCFSAPRRSTTRTAPSRRRRRPRSPRRRRSEQTLQFPSLILSFSLSLSRPSFLLLVVR